MPIIKISIQLAKVAQVFITRPGETFANHEVQNLTGVCSTTVRVSTRKLQEKGVLNCDTCFDDGHRFKLSDEAPLDILQMLKDAAEVFGLSALLPGLRTVTVRYTPPETKMIMIPVKTH